MSDTLQPRWGHSTTAVSLAPGLTDVTIFGGSTDTWRGSLGKQPILADTTLLQFCKYLGMTLRSMFCPRMGLRPFLYVLPPPLQTTSVNLNGSFSLKQNLQKLEMKK